MDSMLSGARWPTRGVSFCAAAVWADDDYGRKGQSALQADR